LFFRYIPDPVIFCLGVLFLLPGLPLFVSLIGGSEIVFFGLVRLVEIFPFLGTLPTLVFDLGAKVGAPFMKDSRDGAYFLPIVFLTLWSPLIFLWALSRYQRYGFEITTLLAYHALRLTPRYRLFAYMHVLLHKVG
jgi:hypothetical protein